MDRVLNKDFAAKSYNNTLIAFSDVFHPACCMQKFPAEKREGFASLFISKRRKEIPVHPAKENLMRSKAC